MKGTSSRGSKRHAFAVATALTLSGTALHASPLVASRAQPTHARVPRGARFLIDVGSFSVGANVAQPGLGALARDALVGRLATEGSVVLGEGDEARVEVERILRRHHLRGFFIDGRVRVTEGTATSRVEVSLVVQTHPGREYRFESEVSVTLSGGSASQRSANIEAATRRAVASAATRALGQISES